MNPLERLLNTHETILADGATGTTLMEMGLTHGNPPEEWNVTHPDRIRKMHRDFIAAGSQIILTNTFGGTRFRLELHGFQDRVTELNLAAARLAREEADRAPRLVVVGGSMGPSGGILVPLGDLEFEDARDGFAEQAEALAAGGVDVLWIETMSDLGEVRAAAEGARMVSDLPLVITMTFDTNGHTMMGVSPVKALEAIREFNPIALGGNCGNGPGEIKAVIAAMAAVSLEVPLVAKSNAGIPRLVGDLAHFDATPEDMAAYAVQVRDLGATIIGGCCGNSAEHIRSMAEALESTPIQRRTAVVESPTNSPEGRTSVDAKPKRSRRRIRRRKV